jgi:hypothetical protein
MDMQLNNNVFNQLASDRDYLRQAAGLAATRVHSSEQSFGPGWPGQYQAENGERTKNAALAHLSIDLLVESAGTAVGSCLVVECKAWPTGGKHRAEQKNLWPAPGGTAEHTSVEIAYRVALSLMESEQITLARKALAALPVGQLSDPMIMRLRKMLALPVAKTSEKRDIDRALDYQWIRDHAQDYRGQWVAVEKGKLLGAATSLRELLDHVKPLRSEHRPLVHQIS